MRDDRFCFWHSPDRAEEAADARRLGGQRRRREATVSGAYDVDGLDGMQLLQRILEIVTVDTLTLENSIERSRVLIQLVGMLLKVRGQGAVEDQLAGLEALMAGRRQIRS